MATIKSFTDISQSKHLLELGLNPETADMYWSKRKAFPEYTDIPEHPEVLDLVAESMGIVDTPAWSLAALLSVLPNSIYDNTNEFSQLEFTKKSVAYIHGTTGDIKIGTLKDNLIDACYEMILELNELNLL